MTVRSNADLAQAWLVGRDDADAFRDLATDGCRVWHSPDNWWVSVDETIQGVQDNGGLPPMCDTGYAITENWFLVQLSATIGASRSTIRTSSPLRMGRRRVRWSAPASRWTSSNF